MTLASIVAGDQIGRLVLQGWPEGEPPPQLEEFTPPGVGEAILLLRRVVVVSELGDVGESVQAEVAAAARTAVRPHHGRVPADAEAVLFADAAELLACYVLSLIHADVAPDWLWSQVAGLLPPPALTAVLHDPATPVCAVVAVLSGWGLLDEAVGGIDAAGAKRVVDVVAARHALWVRAVDGPGPLPDGRMSFLGEDPPTAQTASSGWELGRLGSTVVLGVVVAGGGFAASLGLLAQVVLGRDPGAPGLPAPSPASLIASTTSSPTRPPAALCRPPGLPNARSADGPAGAEQSGRAGPRSHRVHRVGVRCEALGRDVGIAPAAGPAQGPTAESAQPEAAGHDDEGVATWCGGVLYLVNPYCHLDLTTAGLIDAAPWDVLEGLGREALRAVDALDDDDALWDVLAALAGRSPGERPGPVVLAGCRAALDVIGADLVLGPDEPRLGELLLVPGHLRVSHAQIKLVAPLGAVHLSVRRRALDADPGWVPELARVVRFDFVGGGSR